MKERQQRRSKRDEEEDAMKNEDFIEVLDRMFSPFHVDSSLDSRRWDLRRERISPNLMMRRVNNEDHQLVHEMVF